MSVRRFFPALVVLMSCCATTVARGQNIPDKVVKQLGSLVGTWKIEVRLGDKVAHENLTCTWSGGKDAVIWEWKGTDITNGVSSTSTGIIGWDGREEVLVEMGVGSTGETFRATHTLGLDQWDSPTKGTRMVDGKIVREESLRVFKFATPDELLIDVKDRKLKGESQPEITSIFRRVK